MSMPPLAAEAPALLLYAVLFVVVVRRSVQLSRGVAVSPSRLFLQGGLYLVLFAVTAILDVPVLPTWTLAVDAAVLAAGAAIGATYVRRVTEFQVRPDGTWMYRLGLRLPLLFLGLFAVRIVVELLVLPSPFGGPTPTTALTATQQFALAGVEALFALSAGLLVGRSIGVYNAYRERRRNLPPVPQVPPPPPLGL